MFPRTSPLGYRFVWMLTYVCPVCNKVKVGPGMFSHAPWKRLGPTWYVVVRLSSTPGELEVSSVAGPWMWAKVMVPTRPWTVMSKKRLLPPTST